MYLFINTSNQKEMTVALINREGEILLRKKVRAEYQQAEKLLPQIKSVLPSKADFKKIKGIIIVTGPGGFTSLRIGVATANALAWALNIPLAGVVREAGKGDNKLLASGLKLLPRSKRFKPVLPFYDKEPNITMNKR